MVGIGTIGELIVKIKAEDAKETAAEIKDVQETTKKAGQEAKRQVPVLEKMGRRWGAVLGLVAASGAVAFGMILKSSPSVMGALKGMQLAFEDIFGLIGEELSPIFEGLEGILYRVADAFAALSPETRTLISGLVLGVIVVGALAAAALAVVAVGPLVTAALAAIGIGLGSLLLIIAAVIAVVAVLFTAWKYNWWGIRDIAKKIWNWLGQKWHSLMAIFKDENMTMWQKVKAIWRWMVQHNKEVLIVIYKVVSKIWKAIKNIIVDMMKEAYAFVIEKFNAMKDALRNTIRYFANHPIIKKIRTIGGISGRRQFGGPVSAGAAYMVGEAGPEMFMPNVSGSIVPNNRISDTGGAPVTSSGRPINLNLELKLDGRTVWESVRRYSAAELRRLGG